MTTKSNVKLLRNISDTARWVAYYRAMETERSDAIFRDPYARKLAGQRGEEIVRTLRGGKRSAWAMIVRTALFDELILKVLAREAVDAVLNLAAGLDTRPYRLPLTSSLQWVEVDFPETIAYKEELLAGESPRCQLERVPLDLAAPEARRSLFARINERASRVLVVAEGLLAYLTAEQVGNLAADLHAQPHFRYWLIDLASPWVLRRMKKHWGKHLDAASAPVQFAPENGAEFFRRFGWTEEEFRPFFQEAQRLKREIPMAWLLHFYARVAPRRFEKQLEKWKSGTVLLARI